jgi:hypothetical protein
MERHGNGWRAMIRPPNTETLIPGPSDDDPTSYKAVLARAKSFYRYGTGDDRHSVTVWLGMIAMEMLILVGPIILIGKYWRYVWRVVVGPAVLFAILVGLFVHNNIKEYDAKHAATQHQETVEEYKHCTVDGQDAPPWQCP